jgi:starch-binding outer membrane protein, SusD/RagB family
MKKLNFQIHPVLLSGIFSFYFITIVFFSGCKKLIDINPPGNSYNGDNLFTTDETAASSLTGIYTKMSNGAFISSLDLCLLPGMSADEIKLDLNNAFNTSYVAYYENNLTSLNTTQGAPDFWNTLYPTIFAANLYLEGLKQSDHLTPAVKNQLIGEAEFIRAFCYFYLVNFYGDVPIVQTTDYQANSNIPRSDKQKVYEFIIADLKDAESLMSENFLDATVKNITTERTRPNKWAAAALLARTYLFIADYADAETESSKIINNSSLFSLPDLSDVFLKNNNEAIWQIQPVGDGTNSNTPEGALFILPATGTRPDFPVYLSERVVADFEPGDKRRSTWIDSVIVDKKVIYYPFKYKIGQVNTDPGEYSVLFRLAEQYLIRAEARMNMDGRVADGIADLNILRERSRAAVTSETPDPLPALSTGLSKEVALNAVLHERRVELFTECAHRWLDLKRTGKINDVMTSATLDKGYVWNSYQQLYPIPQTEINRNPALKGKQNPGYN